MKTYFGFSYGFHDASLAVVRGDQILSASHSERYSRIKNDKWLSIDQVNEALEFGDPDKLIYYERQWLKHTRQWYSGEDKIYVHGHLKSYFPKQRIHQVSHHCAHASAGYFTSPFTHAAVIVIDAIGEWETLTVWHAKGRKLKKIFRITYPDSLGLLYSAFTQRLGFKPNEEEYIMMGLAACGEPKWKRQVKETWFHQDGHKFTLPHNVHLGIKKWMPGAKDEDLAASIQTVLEEYLIDLFKWAQQETGEPNVVFMGGVALNCVANGKLLKEGIFDNWWIMPNPGDAGSSLGSILAYKNDFVEWNGPYLGTEIRRSLDPIQVVDGLEKDKIVGIANGRAEYGPRAFGNRSILADPRTAEMKDRVNEIKKRESFRPFAGVVLEEKADQWFEMYGLSQASYMQFTLPCKQPEKIPAVCHVDNTSRIQTVNAFQNPALYNILRNWYLRTGCPVLLNTSLNVKGMPLVNTWKDVKDFQVKHDIEIF